MYLLTMLFYHVFFLFFLTTDSYFLTPAVIIHIFNRTEELAISIGIPTNEAKAETKTQSVSVEAKISTFST